MTTEKKKREPKPTKTTEVSILIDLFIPFIEAKNDELLLRAAATIGQALDNINVVNSIDPLTNKWQQDDYTEENIELARKCWGEKDFQHLKETIFYFKRAINQACNGKHTKTDYETGNDIALWLTEWGKHIQLGVTVWGGPNGCGASFGYPKEWLNPKSYPSHWPLVIRAWGAFLISTTFQSKSTSKFTRGEWITKMLLSPGNAYIGACPRCKKIFAKKRLDEMYDRKTCQVQSTKGNTKKI